MEAPAVEPVAELAEIRLQVFRACTVVSTLQKGFRVANDGVEPFQMLTVRIKIRRLVVVSFSERLDIAAVAISLNGCAFFNGGIHKLLYCRPLYIRHYSHFQELRMVFAVLRHANNHTLVSGGTTTLTLDFCSEVGVVQLNVIKIVTLGPTGQRKEMSTSETVCSFL